MSAQKAAIQRLVFGDSDNDKGSSVQVPQVETGQQYTVMRQARDRIVTIQSTYDQEWDRFYKEVKSAIPERTRLHAAVILAIIAVCFQGSLAVVHVGHGWPLGFIFVIILDGLAYYLSFGLVEKSLQGLSVQRLLSTEELTQATVRMKRTELCTWFVDKTQALARRSVAFALLTEVGVVKQPGEQWWYNNQAPLTSDVQRVHDWLTQQPGYDALVTSSVDDQVEALVLALIHQHVVTPTRMTRCPVWASTHTARVVYNERSVTGQC